MSKFKLLKQLYKMEKVVSKHPELKAEMENWIQNNYGTTSWKDLTVDDITKTIEHYKKISPHYL